MIITEKTSIMFTLPEDDERLKLFVSTQDMNKWKRERLAPNVICYTCLRAKKTIPSIEEEEEKDA